MPTEEKISMNRHGSVLYCMQKDKCCILLEHKWQGQTGIYSSAEGDRTEHVKHHHAILLSVELLVNNENPLVLKYERIYTVTGTGTVLLRKLQYLGQHQSSPSPQPLPLLLSSPSLPLSPFLSLPVSFSGFDGVSHCL